jgi:hypothetical protein
MGGQRRAHEGDSEHERPHKLRNEIVRGKHPLGIQPWGNAYMQGKTDVGALCRHRGLGRLSMLQDQDILNIFGFFSAKELCRFATVSKSFYVFAQYEDLWRTLLLEDVGGQFDFKGTWKQTYQHCKRPDFAVVPKPLVLDDFFSDLLFQPWYCATVGIKPEWLEVDNIDRRSNISVVEFIDQYERPNRPVIITDAVTQWPAYKLWKKEYLLEHHGDMLVTAAGFKFTMKQYYDMSEQCCDESPLYLFDARFAEKAPELGQQYDVRLSFRGMYCLLRCVRFVCRCVCNIARVVGS